MLTAREWVQLYIKYFETQHSIKIEIKPKSESKLLNFLNPIVSIFNKNFMSDYVTTIGNTIWYPDGWLDKNDFKSRLQTVIHECIHIKQGKSQPNFIHEFLYLFPQSLSILSLFSLLSVPLGMGWLWCLLFLFFLAPVPAYFRYKKELEAYRIRILFFKHVYNSSEEMLQWTKKMIVENLSKSNYYFAWPFPKWIQKDLDDESFMDEEQYRDIILFLKRHNLLVQ